MSERYSRLFSLPEDQYCHGAPVIVSAGALLKDNESGKVMAQLKFKSIDDHEIKALTVLINTFDTAGRELDSDISHQFLDLNAKRGNEFGQKSPVAIPNSSTRSYNVEVKEVVFSNGSVWTSSGETWKPLAKPKTLDSELLDVQLIKQYKLKFGEDCKYVPSKEDDLWICSCGCVNHENEGACFSCKKQFIALTEGLNKENLSAEKDERLKAEQEQADKEKAEAAAKSKKTKKIIAIAAPIAAVLVVAAVLLSSYMKKVEGYNSAISTFESGRYDAAIEMFTELGDFKDSPEQIETIKKEKDYRKYIKLADSRDFIGAINGFKELAEYKDSREQVENVKAKWYDYAKDLFAKKSFDDAQSAFSILGGMDYKDSAEMAETVKETKNEKNYQKALALFELGIYARAKEAFDALGDYKDAREYSLKIVKLIVSKNFRTKFRYNNDGLMVSFDDDCTWEYSSDKKTVIMITNVHSADKLKKVIYKFGDKGQLIEEEETYNAANNNWQDDVIKHKFSNYVYNSDGVVLSRTVTTIEYRGEKGEELKETKQSTYEETFKIDSTGKCIEFKSSRRGTYKFSYDDDGYVTKIIAQGYNDAKLEYDWIYAPYYDEYPWLYNNIDMCLWWYN